MRLTRVCLTLSLALLVTNSALAQAALRPAESRRLEVTPQGAFVHRTAGWATPSLTATKSTAPGLVWEKSDGGLAWIASAVSIGDRGYQVFTEYDLNSEAAELLSAFDSNPPTPVWTDNSPLGTEFRYVASADADDTKVVIDQIVLGGQMSTRQAVLRKYTSSSSTPDWTYTFAPVINAGANVGISRDGQTIVAAVYDDSQNEMEIAVFGPSSGTPLSYTVVTLAPNDYLRGFDLSADGSTLYYSAGITAHVFDVASQTDVFTTNIGSSFDSHAISGDGSVFAFGNFNVLRIFEKQGGTYVNTYNESVGGQCYCAFIDISDDSSTVASAWTFYGNYLTVRVDAIDVATKTVAMSHTVTGTGTLQNVPSSVSISADGSRFAVGFWGDAGGVVPECRIYSRASSVPLVSVDLPGSVFDCDLSADGQRAVFGSKAIHANINGNGGKVDLVTVGGEDFALRGVPRIGSTVEFDLYFTPGKNAFLMQALDEDPTPNTYPGIGTLFIQRSTLTFQPAGVVPASGIAIKSLSIANNPALIGTPLYFQGFSVPPRQLSNDWIKMTILP